MDKKKVKEYIEEQEIFHAGLGHISGAWAKIVNLRLTKQNEKGEFKASYDVIMHPEEGRYERFNSNEVNLHQKKDGEFYKKILGTRKSTFSIFTRKN